MKNSTLKKFTVCTDCFSVGISSADCVCYYDRNYKTIELEFEVCICCGHLISDGRPAETEFNNKQLATLQ